jgi:hypothetical protein
VWTKGSGDGTERQDRSVDSTPRGVDDDWSSWYTDWLLNLSELEQLLGARPIRSHLVHALVQLDRDHTSTDSDEPWPDYYARHLRTQFAPT